MIIKMTNRERLLAALRRKPVDYIPFVGRFNPLTPVQRQGIWNFPWPEEGGEDAIRKITNGMGIMVNTYVHPAIWAGLEKCKVNIVKNGNILHKEIMTPAGPLTAMVERNELWPHDDDIPLATDFTAHFKKAWITCPEDIERLRYIFGAASDYPRALTDFKAQSVAAAARSEKHDIAVIAPAGSGLTLALQMFLPEPLMLAVMESPELVDSFLKLEHRITMKNIKLACESGCDIISRNGFYETCDFYSPNQLRRFLKAHLTEECELAHSYGKLIVYTLHTGIMPMIDYLKEIPLDAIFGIDPSFPGMDLKKLKSELGDRFAFEMGPCSIREISSKNPNDVRPVIRNLIDVFGKTGFVLTPSVSMHSIMPWENFEATVDEWRIRR